MCHFLSSFCFIGDEEKNFQSSQYFCPILCFKRLGTDSPQGKFCHVQAEAPNSAWLDHACHDAVTLHREDSLALKAV